MTCRTEAVEKEVAQSHGVYIAETEGSWQFATKLRLVKYLLSRFRIRHDESSEL